MVEPKHLPNAPITEAVLDIRVKPRENFTLPPPDKLSLLLGGDFKEVRRLHVLTHQFYLQDPKPATTNREIEGYQFWTVDKKYVAGFRRGAFSFGRLKPYTEWGDLFGQMQKLWPVYVEQFGPTSITRMAVRYINRIELPPTFADFEEYLTAPPNLPPEIPQTVSNFVGKTVVHDTTNHVSASITQAIEPGGNKPGAILLLDIDAYRRVELTDVRSDKIWQTFEELRNFKNLIFFASLTPKAIEMFL